MISEILNMNGYGLYVWSSFIFTLLSFGTLYFVIKIQLNKELTNINLEIDIINKRLNNPMFIEKAPSNVINEVKTKQSIYTQRKFEIEKALLNI